MIQGLEASSHSTASHTTPIYGLPNPFPSRQSACMRRGLEHGALLVFRAKMTVA